MKTSNITFLCLATGYILSMPPVYAQGIHYLQFDATPLAVNPAFTGMFDGNVRATALYRNEWTGVSVPYITLGASIDMPLFTDKKGNYLAGGIQLIRDQAGDNNLTNLGGLLSVAYHKFFGTISGTKDNYASDLAFGLQVADGSANINVNNLFFGNNNINGALFPGIGVPYFPTENYLMVNTGLCFSSATPRFNYTIGFSGNNLNQPNDANKEGQYTRLGIDRSFSAVFGANWLIGNRLSLRPSIFFQTKENSSALIAGNEFHYIVSKALANNATSVFVGGWYRTGDVCSVTAGIELKSFRVGLGYDYNLSPVNAAVNTGGFEVAVKYIAPGKGSAHKRDIPCNRF